MKNNPHDAKPRLRFELSLIQLIQLTSATCVIVFLTAVAASAQTDANSAQDDPSSNGGPGGHEYARKTFNYGPNGWTEEKMTLDVASGLEHKIAYRYDARNNLVDAAGYDSNASLVGRTSHALQYDNVGNWIQRVSHTWDIHTGKPDSEWIDYQTIDYY